MMNKATIVRVDGTTEELESRPTLEEAQQIVGGYVALVKAKDHWGNSVTLVVDEEGDPKGKPRNNSISLVYGHSVRGEQIVGNVIVLEGWRTVG